MSVVDDAIRAAMSKWVEEASCHSGEIARVGLEWAEQEAARRAQAHSMGKRWMKRHIAALQKKRAEIQ
eukprot:2941575-Karenia_brevis.AAC.1